MVRTNRISTKIFKLDGRDCFMEITNERFFEEKVHFNFSKYDNKKEQGQRITERVDFFLTFSNVLNLCHDITSGRLEKELYNDRLAYRKALLDAETNGTECNYYYPSKAYWIATRGTEVNKMVEKRADGMAESRTMKIVGGAVNKKTFAHPNPNERIPNRFAIVCESGPGEKKESRNGVGFVIQPTYKKPECSIIIPIPDYRNPYNSDNKLVEMAKTLESAIHAYWSAGYSYEYMNPSPVIISAQPVKQKIHVGEQLDIVMYTPKNVTKILTYIGNKEVHPDIPMEAKPTDIGTLEWHFKIDAKKAWKYWFEFEPYVEYEKGLYRKKVLCEAIQKQNNSNQQQNKK